jgi:5'-nucleotidase
VRIAFDGDAVLFADASEVEYKQQGLDSFQEQEDARRHEPMADASYA